MGTILVTGATGNIGHRIVNELRGIGAPTRAFVRNTDKANALFGGEVELAQGDYGDPRSIRCALEGVDIVLLSCSNDPRQVEYESNVIDAAAEAGVRRLVKLSTIGASPGSPAAFWEWHGRAEEHLRHSGVPHVILQSSFYMSNLLANAESVRHMGQFFTPAGNGKISMIDPRDVAAVAALVLASDGHEGNTYVLTGPEAITFTDVARAISSVTGRPVEHVDVPGHAAREGMIGSGMPEWMADQVVILFGQLRQNAACLTTNTVRELTGHEPRSAVDFVRDHAQVFGC